MSEVFDLRPGNSPLLVSIPHSGLRLADGLARRMTPAGLLLADTDWHVPKLYDFLAEVGASVISANFSRYVVDLNRPPDGAALYPGKRETGLCPVATFSGEPVYLANAEPDADEIAERSARFWLPYHEALAAQLERLRSKFGYALLWDAHSIRSSVPLFFEGRLPDLNLGTADDTACALSLADALRGVLGSNPFTTVSNGRFKGGYITRHYGDPALGIHAVQMEIAQISYMSEAPDNRFDESRASRLRPVLRLLIQTFLQQAAMHS